MIDFDISNRNLTSLVGVNFSENSLNLFLN